MTQFESGRDERSPRLSRRQAVVLFLRRLAFATTLVVAAVGTAAYLFVPGLWRGPTRAQTSPVRERAQFLIKQGERIYVPPGSQLRNKLVIAPVAEKEIRRKLALPAVVEVDPTRTVKVLSPVAGQVVDVAIQVGARVAQGDVLAVIESGDLAQAFADQDKARAAQTLAKQTLDRLLGLEKTRAISVKDREQAQSDLAQTEAELARAEQRLRAMGVSPDQKAGSRLPLKALAAGSVIDLQLAPGAYINDITIPVMTIANLETIWVTANVAEKDSALVGKGESAEVVFTAYPGEVFKGQIFFVSDVLDPDTRRTKVRVAFPNPDMRLKPNMFAIATLLAPKQNLPAIPTTALVLKDETDQVFVEVAPWTFESRAVRVSALQGDEAAVEDGIKVGDRIVVTGGVLLND
jgi:cobalt-zinc-cadmium efflux system membrane fusion protein